MTRCQRAGTVSQAAVYVAASGTRMWTHFPALETGRRLGVRGVRPGPCCDRHTAAFGIIKCILQCQHVRPEPGCVLLGEHVQVRWHSPTIHHTLDLGNPLVMEVVVDSGFHPSSVVDRHGRLLPELYHG